MSTFLSKIEELNNQLKQIGENISENLLQQRATNMLCLRGNRHRTTYRHMIIS